MRPGGCAVLGAMVVVLGCSGSPREIRAERDRAVARLVAASLGANEADSALIHQVRRLLPGEEIPITLLEDVGADPEFPALERWRGRVGDWEVEALQTTNDSQAGCAPWGTISVISCSASSTNVEESYADWCRRLSAMLEVVPQRPSPLRTVWLENRRAPWHARWRASVAITSGGELTIEMSCGDTWTGLRSRRTGNEAHKAR